MTIEARTLLVAGLAVVVVRKAIKNLHVGVYPPEGRVRVAAPVAMSDDAIRVAVISRLPWIQRHRTSFDRQVRQPTRELVSGESHYYRGRRYRLEVVEADEPPGVTIRGGWLRLRVRPGATTEERARVLERWYRERLRALAEPLLAEWQARLGVSVQAWGIKRMKTKWGSCNPVARRLLLNLELVKKAPSALEYLVVHELMHLRVKNHGDRFVALMNEHLPPWVTHRAELNDAPLAAELWGR